MKKSDNKGFTEKNTTEYKSANSETEKIKELVSEVKLYNNPELLEKTKKLIRKNVPLTMRGYLLAYLFVQNNAHVRHHSTKPIEKKYDSARLVQSHNEIEGSVSLYINIGRLCKAPSYALIQFICQETGLAEQEILSLTYKQNYSFFCVKEEKAQFVIDNLNGKIYRGRKIKINFSKDSNAD